MKDNSPLSIIIADDHPSVRYGIKSVLEDLEFISRVNEASDGSKVLSFLEKRTYDIVLLDIKMPVMDGYETTRKIKELYPCVKIIILSMFTEERYVLEMLELGVSGYLIKNADRKDIIEAIKTVMRDEIYISKEISLSTFKKAAQNEIISKRKSIHDETLREIIYLLCQELGSKEIAQILCFSKRTIDKYRDHITRKIGTKNLAGTIKYAIEHGIHEDVLLKNKFSKFLVEV